MLGMKVSLVNLDGIKSLLENAGAAAHEISAAAVNDAVAHARKLGADAILDQVNFPDGYLDLPGRFEISQKATSKLPEARLTARARSTSLAAFAARQGGARDGVIVKVKRHGGAKTMRRAFIMSLRNGNRGVAIRTRSGKPENAWKPKKLDDDPWGTLWLLYGKSVNQAFAPVSAEIKPKVSQFLASRFMQLYSARLGK